MGGSLPKLARVGSAEIDLALSSLEGQRPILPKGPKTLPAMPERPTRQSLEAVRLADEEARIAKAEARLTGDSDVMKAAPAIELAAFDASEPSGISTVTANDDRVVAMRELYTRSETAGAPELGSFGEADLLDGLTLEAEGPLVGGAADDPYGGLIPIEDEGLSLDDPPDLPLVSARPRSSRPARVNRAASSSPMARTRPPVEVDPGFEAGLPIVGAAPTQPTTLVPDAADTLEADVLQNLDVLDVLEELEELEEAAADELIPLSSIIPRVLLGPSEISRLPMDPKAAFILSHVDGMQSMEEILDICAMPEADAVELLDKLRALGVISM